MTGTGNIASWKKKEGEKIGAGEEMAEIETDKVHSLANPGSEALVAFTMGLVV